jgi:hypothetical protein
MYWSLFQLASVDASTKERNANMNKIALLTASMAFALISGSAFAAQVSSGGANSNGASTNNGKVITGTNANGSSQNSLSRGSQKGIVDKSKENTKSKANVR